MAETIINAMLKYACSSTLYYVIRLELIFHNLLGHCLWGINLNLISLLKIFPRVICFTANPEKCIPSELKKLVHPKM